MLVGDGRVRLMGRGLVIAAVVLASVACGQGDDAKILAEQINPYTGESLSVSPLAWSHGEAVRTINAYLNRAKELG